MPAQLRAMLEPVLLSSGVTGESAGDVITSIEAVLDAMRAGDRARVDGSVLPGVDTGGDTGASEAKPFETTAAVSAGAVEASGDLPEPSATDRELAARSSNFWDQAPPEIGSATADAASEEVEEKLDVDPADVERIRKLEVGAWVEMISEDGTPQPAKLSWVSPISSRLLFVNRRGMRVCASSAEELALMLKQGRLNLREVDTAFERAMTQVLGKLRETQAQRPRA
jgi:hypothetical protein